MRKDQILNEMTKLFQDFDFIELESLMEVDNKYLEEFIDAGRILINEFNKIRYH